MIIYRLPNADYRYKLTVSGVDKVIVGDIIGLYTEYLPVEFGIDGWEGGFVDLSAYGNYDRSLVVTTHNYSGDILTEEFVEIVRPYVIAPASMTSDEKIDFYAKERIARTIVDSLTGGFYFKREMVAYESLGGDVIPLQQNIVRIIRAYENGTKVFDALDPSFENTKVFGISPDRTSIIVHSGEYVNRRYGESTTPKWAPSDYLYATYDSVDMAMAYYAGEFPKGTDYIFDVEMGYRHLPSDISVAVEMLIASGSCTDQYLNRYITEYDTDQYRIKYAKDSGTGTGNRQVDMILAKYINTSGHIRAGVM